MSKHKLYDGIFTDEEIATAKNGLRILTEGHTKRIIDGADKDTLTTGMFMQQLTRELAISFLAMEDGRIFRAMLIIMACKPYAEKLLGRMVERLAEEETQQEN